MRVLIVTHGRSGSTNLMFALSDAMGVDPIIEPFNDDLWTKDWRDKDRPYRKGDPIAEHCLFKCVVNHSEEWLYRNASRFDRVIFLARENMREVAISATNAHRHGYFHKYEVTEGPDDMMYAMIASSYEQLLRMNHALDNTKLVWYNQLYSGNKSSAKEKIQSLDMDISDEKFEELWDKYFHPRHRLREI